MNDLLSKARLGRLAALDKRPTNEYLRDIVHNLIVAQSGSVVKFRSRRIGLVR